MNTFNTVERKDVLVSMNEKKISIIIPVYNRGNTIERCITSVINQSYDKIEIIIVNDGSTDNTLTICEKMKEKDKRIEIINIENQGVSVARNKGIEFATGDYIQFVDSDDYLETDILEEAIKAIKDNDLLIYGYQTVTEEEEYKMFKLEDNIWKNNEIYKQVLNNINNGVIMEAVWNKLYKKVFMDKIRFEKNMVNGEDLLFNIQYYKKCKKIKAMNKIGYNYCVKNKERKYRENQIENHIEVVETLEEYFKEGIERQQYIDILSDFFYNTIFYDLLSITGKNGISIKQKMKEYNKIKQSKFYKNIKYRNNLSSKKNIIINLYRKNNIITYYIIKFYFKIER